MYNPQERYTKTLEEWKKFTEGGTVSDVDSSVVCPVILDAWIKARDLSVNPRLKRITTVLQGEELEELLEENAELIETSTPFLETLYESMQGSNFLCTLCDAKGYILKIVGDSEIIENVKRGNFVPGALASEESIGPNGIGTALDLDKPVQVFATEHYCYSFHRFTCQGAPIHDPEGKTIGVINATGPYLEANPHTLGMVVAAAHAIENLLQVKEALSVCQLADNFQKVVIASIPEALIAVDKRGGITLINQNAEKMFGLKSDQAVGQNIKDVLGEHNERFIDIISNNRCIWDEEVRIYSKESYSDYTLTFNLILSPQKQVLGKIIILNEIKRVRSLVTRMTGAKARITFTDIVGKNSNFQETIRLAQIASQSTSNVLLLGESGTGKDIFAQSIHNNSTRKDNPYVVINCAAIPRDLIASELFGYSEGAFTGSKRGGNPGKFEIADGGTIFLDEIGEMPLELQTTLLRVIENKEIMRIGGKKVSSVDVRILAATNKDLSSEVSKGNFREDLYYRLNVFTIRLLPLRERKDDIPLLVERFAKDIGSKMGKRITIIPDEVIEALMHYSWPGNVRELQNVLERAINIAPGDALSQDLLPQEIKQTPQTTQFVQEDTYSLKDIERQMIMNMIKTNASKAEIAKKMKISRSTLYRKLESYGIL
ncbi:MAG: sigma-54-dependent Fis family transcriptional regulator [Desulfomonilia bacterium]